MTKKENQVLSILFERKKIKRKKDGAVYYSYTPLEIVDGKEVTIGKGKTLECDSVKSLIMSDNPDDLETKEHTFSHITDIYSLEDKYVYGFSLLINEKNKKNLEQYKKETTELIKDLRNFTIIHVVNENLDYENKLFLTRNNSSVGLEGQNYYELFDLLYSTVMDDIHEITNKKKKTTPSSRSSIVLPSDYIYSDQIFNTVTKTVKCQDEAVRKVATAIAKNSRLESPSLKSNLLVVGPTGVGKSEIFRSIRDNFGIPVAFEDSTEYTASGYKGKEVIEMLIHLIQEANGDIEKAQRGILVVDEIDKKVSKSGQLGEFEGAVINSLLKMMEGHVYNIPVKGGEIQFDTSQLSFAFLGAFSGINEYSSKRQGIGFLTVEQIKEMKDVKNIYNTDTIHKYGMLPEFIGRCDTLVTLDDLEVPDLMEIIKTSDKSQLLLYKFLFNDLGIDFIYDEKTIEAIAIKAKELKLGARSVKAIVENAFEIINYLLFSRKHYRKLIISPETIEDNRQFILK